MEKKYLQNKGFTTGDVVIAIGIIIIFASLISTLSYNYYLSITSKNRNAIAISSVIDVIENVEAMDYDNVDSNTVNSLLESLKENGTIKNGYTITATLQKYNETEGNTNKHDVIKILTVNVNYLVGQKEENFEIRTLIKKQ